MYDLIVIGGGPGGYRAAERAGRAGLKVLLIEERALGGVCLNEGCIPSKTLLGSAKVYDYALHGGSYGITTKSASIDHAAVVARKDRVVETLAGGVKALMKQNKVTVIMGKATITGANSVSVNGDAYSAGRLIVATGSVPVVPPIPGLKEGMNAGMVLTTREILNLQACPEKLVIIGAGVAGLEMAAYYATVGSKVTVIEMLPKIAGATDADITDILMRSYEKRGVEFLLRTRAAAITEAGVEYARADGEGQDGSQAGLAPADKVLLSIGRTPAIDGFGLENTGVLVENGSIATDLNNLTSAPCIYAVGDVNGKYMLAHAAYREAEVAVNHILGKRDIMRYGAVPSVIYTSPEVATVGESEESARAIGVDPQSVTVPMAHSGRFIAENDHTDGICKVVIDRKLRTIIGVHMIGSYVSEVILGACAMIEMQMRVDDVRELVFPHPTVGEIIREAAFRL